MLSTKKISEMFDIPKTTLYGWKTERPKVYEYLANADEQYSKYREVNILLDRYIQSASSVALFEYKELEYILKLEFKNQNVEDIENLHLNFINTSMKIEKQNNTFTLDIYKKLEKLNLIEKYIFIDNIRKVSSKIKVKKEEKESLIKHYFKNFLTNP